MEEIRYFKDMKNHIGKKVICKKNFSAGCCSGGLVVKIIGKIEQVDGDIFVNGIGICRWTFEKAKIITKN